MERLSVLVCLGLICVASTLAQVPIPGVAQVVDPRGARPVEQGTRSETCATQRDWPFCSDDEWGSKCPSGCRILGLINKYDHGALKKIEKIRSLLDLNKVKHRTTDQVSKQTYDYLKDKLTVDSDSDNSYYNLAQTLRQRISDMKIKIDRQLRTLAALKDRVKDQVVEMQRLEVDIDIKLRSCKGSCQGYTQYQVDRESYVTLEKQVSQLDSQSVQNIESVGTLYVMKSRPLQGVIVDSIYKSSGTTTGEQKDMFPEVRAVQLVLEQEGSSSSSPATISKVPVCTRLKRQNQDGRQPSSHTPPFRNERCRATPDAAALCSDDDWVSKCPSGCRLQGLISQMESKAERKLRKVCTTAKVYEDAAEKSRATMTRVYGYNWRVIANALASERTFVERAQGLAGNLTSLRKRSSRLSRKLVELHGIVRKQMEDLYRTEVDVDMKLRGCYGSCRAVLPFSVDRLGYQTDMDEMDRALNQRRKAGSPPEHIPRIKLQPVDVSPARSAECKSIPTAWRELLTQFEDLGANRVILEARDPAELD